jgi:transcriptional regulator of nitric oxide reductase
VPARALPGVLAAFVFGLGLACSSAGPAQAKVFYTRQQALEMAFPDADRIDKKVHILSGEQIARIQIEARAKVESKLVTLYTAWKGDEVLGYANIDVHTVRTHPSALLVVWTPDGTVRTVRILAFHEPLDYLPADKWYEQFDGKTRADRLKVGDDVHGVVNATLSTQVASDSVRRALAYHAVLIAPEAAE